VRAFPANAAAFTAFDISMRLLGPSSARNAMYTHIIYNVSLYFFWRSGAALGHRGAVAEQRRPKLKAATQLTGAKADLKAAQTWLKMQCPAQWRPVLRSIALLRQQLWHTPANMRIPRLNKSSE
jgi:hypothetical protein